MVKQMNGEISAETLSFHDLSREESHGLAHVENDIRAQAGEMMARAAFSKNPNEIIAEAKELIDNQNERDYAWLIDQARVRNSIPIIPIDSDPAMYLRLQFKRTGLTNLDVATRIGVSQGQMSAFVKGRRKCSEEQQKQLAEIFNQLPSV